MEDNRRFFLKKHRNPQFKGKGVIKKGKWLDSGPKQSREDSHTSKTMYKILCSVIGKGGGIIKVLREETQAKITVTDSSPGSNGRVIMILSPTKLVRKQTVDNVHDNQDNKKGDVVMEPHCAAQDALLKVHDRIVEEDLGGGENNGEIVVTARLLVPNNMVVCLLGKKGDVIQRLRSETHANIHVLSADHLPSRALSSDELVQISGKPEIARKALYEVSTLLHQNPRKDKPPLSFPLGHSTPNFHPPALPVANMFPQGNSVWSRHNPNEQGRSMPWTERFGNQPSGYGPGEFDGFPPPGAGDPP